MTDKWTTLNQDNDDVVLYSSDDDNRPKGIPLRDFTNNNIYDKNSSFEEEDFEEEDFEEEYLVDSILQLEKSNYSLQFSTKILSTMLVGVVCWSAYLSQQFIVSNRQFETQLEKLGASVDDTSSILTQFFNFVKCNHTSSLS